MTKSQKQGRLYLQVTIVLVIVIFNLLAYAVNKQRHHPSIFRLRKQLVKQRQLARPQQTNKTRIKLYFKKR